MLDATRAAFVENQSGMMVTATVSIATGLKDTIFSFQRWPSMSSPLHTKITPNALPVGGLNAFVGWLTPMGDHHLATFRMRC